ncbi:hypothetical protein QQS21_002691 [Conoideocrella luteorostrata]|uniref:Bacteriophage T5 Orf172 DNA-binding domain-containing protein n=1 Tax=Conoideocrella luteorostrata TaxID=1105319 RepID=A0AAJ0FW85_9HYPO|nr:hypothetical protein QQS21_002691 [Conoideocrella luteorostrata]
MYLSLLNIESELDGRRRNLERCCFPDCKKRIEPDQRSTPIRLVECLEHFRLDHHGLKASTDRDRAITKLQAQIIELSCYEHITSVPLLFDCYARDDVDRIGRDRRKAKKEAEKAKPEVEAESPRPTESDAKDSQHQPRVSSSKAPSTPQRQKDKTVLPSHFEYESEFDDDPISPLTTSPDSVFDADNLVQSIEADTPATEIYQEPSGRNTRRYLDRMRRDESPTPNRAQNRNPRNKPPASGEQINKHSLVSPADDADEEDHARVFDRIYRSRSRELTPPTRPHISQCVRTYSNPSTNLKQRLKYIKTLQKDYRSKSVEPGVIYIAWDTNDADMKGMFKVGFTKNTLVERYSSADCRRKHNMKFLQISEQVYVGARHVESLIQNDFYRERYKIPDCPWCSSAAAARTKCGEKGHNEWFRVEPHKLIQRIRAWECVINHLNSYKDGKLDEYVRDALERALDPGNVMLQMERAMNIVPDKGEWSKLLSVKDFREKIETADFVTTPLALKKAGATNVKEKAKNRGQQSNTGPTPPQLATQVISALDGTEQRDTPDDGPLLEHEQIEVVHNTPEQKARARRKFKTLRNVITAIGIPRKDGRPTPTTHDIQLPEGEMEPRIGIARRVTNSLKTRIRA